MPQLNLPPSLTRDFFSRFDQRDEELLMAQAAARASNAFPVGPIFARELEKIEDE